MATCLQTVIRKEQAMTNRVDELRKEFAETFDKALEYITNIAVADAEEQELNGNIKLYDKAYLRLVFAEQFIKSTFKSILLKEYRTHLIQQLLDELDEMEASLDGITITNDIHQLERAEAQIKGFNQALTDVKHLLTEKLTNKEEE